jgi:hypothetical protein
MVLSGKDPELGPMTFNLRHGINDLGFWVSDLTPGSYDLAHGTNCLGSGTNGLGPEAKDLKPKPITLDQR